MTIRKILHYPDKRLRTPGERITQFNDELKQLIDDMVETMYAAPGVGLAATQIGVSSKVFIVDTAAGDEAPSDLRVFINPEIVETEGEVSWEEGCLSFPGVREEIRRAEKVRVRAQDQHGKSFEMDADGLMAIAIQHENDHLEGKLMIDHLSNLKRRLVHKAMIKRAASTAYAEAE